MASGLLGKQPDPILSPKNDECLLRYWELHSRLQNRWQQTSELLDVLFMVDLYTTR